MIANDPGRPDPQARNLTALDHHVHLALRLALPCMLQDAMSLYEGGAEIDDDGTPVPGTLRESDITLIAPVLTAMRAAEACIGTQWRQENSALAEPWFWAVLDGTREL